jgi:hypothetical protein
MQMIDGGKTLRVRHAGRFTRGRNVVATFCWIVLAATAALAQQSGGSVTETVTTLRKRDLNGRDVVSEKVVTHRDRTSDEERVVIEIYLPSMEAGRLELSQRIQRVTTVTDDGSQTVEETKEANRVAPGDPMRIIQRSLTTVRRNGSDSSVTERQIFEPDGNGRLVLVRKQSERTSRN